MQVTHYFQKVIGAVWHNKKKTAIVVVILLVVLFFLRPKTPKPIATEKVQYGTVTQSLSVTGSIASDHQIDMSFLTSGKLVYLPVAKGDHVTSGQVIATQDTQAVQKNLETTLRTYSQQRNTFDQTRQTNQDKPLTDALNRVLQNNQYDLDKAVISVELQNLAKQNSVLVSPVDGYVTRLDVNTAGINVTPATVFEVTDLDHLTFNMDVDESDIGKVVAGFPVRLTLDSFPSQTLTLPVDAIDYTSHLTSTGGTAYTVALKLPANAQYRVGMSGGADIILNEKHHVLKIPLSSLVNSSYVYIKTPKGFSRRDVTLGLQTDTEAEVISGVQEGDEVALNPANITGK